MVRKCRKAKGMLEAGCVRSAKDGIGVSSTYMQLRNRRVVYITVDRRSENSSSVADVVDNNNGVTSSNLSSCCASNDYRNNNVVVDDGGGGFIDLEEERDGDTETSTYQRSTKRKLFENLCRDKESSFSMEKSPEIAVEFDSVIKESSDCCCSGRRSLSTTEEKPESTTEQPTEAEIEDFFAEAEKQLHDKFKKKYNFDFEKEKPLEGRYEWFKVSE
uniref:Cyclin-dependent kinase inhibitor n=2 Tax=Noccaea caerulescens TaxID=107243 RepID=A0A1J3EQ09_NOCCA